MSLDYKVYTRRFRLLDKALRSRRSLAYRQTRLIVLVICATAPAIVALTNHKSDFPKNAVRAQTKPTKLEERPKSFGQLPLSFEVNQGQFSSKVKFVSRGAEGDIYMMSNEVVLRIPKHDRMQSPGLLKTTNSCEENSKFDRVIGRRPASGSRDVVKMRLVEANAAEVKGLDELPGTVNYFVGKDPKKWHTNIRTHSKVIYRSVYPGIDQVFHGNEQRLEYDFIVSPGADPHRIKLAFAGIQNPGIDQGDLVLRVRGSEEIRLKKPFAYQEVNNVKQEVAARYVIKRNHQVGLEVGGYDATKPLIIDPVLSYSTYFGGSGNDAGFDIAVDGNGNTYITGSTDSPEFSSLGGSNAFVAKLNATGTQRTYLAIIGGSGDDKGFSIAVDSSGDAYITGATDSTDFPVTNSIQSSFGGGAQDAFIAKLNPSGSSLVYSTYLGGSGNDTGFAIALDAAGSAYITGATGSPEFSTLGNTDAFVAKLNPAGNERSFFAILGGSGDDSGFGIAVDGEGSAYVVGSTDSSNFTIANALQPNFGGAQDAFVAKVTPTGSALVYSTYFGGTGNDSGFDIATDSAGNAYITGSTDSPEFTNLGGRDVFVTKFNSTGNERTYFTILGGSGDDAGFGIAVDSAGNAYITGSTDSSNFTTANALQPNAAGSQDVFVEKLNSAGSTSSYSTYLGSSENESGFAIAVDNSGSAYVTGFTSSSNFPTASPYQSVTGGNGDAFVLKISGSALAATLQFTFANYGVSEGAADALITVSRAGDASSACTVNYASADGTASERSDYLAAVGTLRFTAGEPTKTIPIFIVNDAFGEGPETFTITLSNPVGCTLGSPAAVTIALSSDEAVNGLNPVKDASFNTDFFVRQHYIDFFNREADASGLAFWKNQIDECTTPECREIRKINVSAAFFLSIEFQQTGYLVYKTNQAAFNSGESLKLRDFLPDLQEIGRGVVVGAPNWEQQLEANKQKFFMDFVQRAKFVDPAAYPTTMTAAQFVDKLNANTFDPLNTGSGGALTPSQRDALVSQLSPNPSSPALRAQVLQSVSENSLFNTRQSNKAFVLMQYFGYLRRNPNDPPEAGLDFAGYNFWLGKLNQFNGNFVNAEMVKAFIVSGEYQQRFGP